MCSTATPRTADHPGDEEESITNIQMTSSMFGSWLGWCHKMCPHICEVYAQRPNCQQRRHPQEEPGHVSHLMYFQTHHCNNMQMFQRQQQQQADITFVQWQQDTEGININSKLNLSFADVCVMFHSKTLHHSVNILTCEHMFNPACDILAEQQHRHGGHLQGGLPFPQGVHLDGLQHPSTPALRTSQQLGPCIDRGAPVSCPAGRWGDMGQNTTWGAGCLQVQIGESTSTALPITIVLLGLNVCSTPLPRPLDPCLPYVLRRLLRLPTLSMLTLSLPCSRSISLAQPSWPGKLIPGDQCSSAPAQWSPCTRHCSTARGSRCSQLSVCEADTAEELTSCKRGHHN